MKYKIVDKVRYKGTVATITWVIGPGTCVDLSIETGAQVEDITPVVDLKYLLSRIEELEEKLKQCVRRVE